MTILLCFALLGGLISFLTHLFLLLGFSLPSNRIALGLNIGIVVMVGARLIVTKELRRGKEWFFDKSLKGIGSRWLKIVIGLIITYGVVSCIFSLVGMFSMLSDTMTTEDSTIALKKLFIGVFSLIMACYAIEFILLHKYKILKEEELQKLRSEGGGR